MFILGRDHWRAFISVLESASRRLFLFACCCSHLEVDPFLWVYMSIDAHVHPQKHAFLPIHVCRGRGGKTPTIKE